MLKFLANGWNVLSLMWITFVGIQKFLKFLNIDFKAGNANTLPSKLKE